MTTPAPESAPLTPAPAAAPPRRGSLLPWVLVLLLLAVIAAGGGLLWTKWQGATEMLEAEDALIRRLSYQLRQIEADTTNLARRGDDLDSAGRRQAQQLAALQNQQEAGQLALARIDETLRGGRSRFQLATVEELLLLANDRVRLARDARGAVLALETADARLAALGDPRLTAVREALVQERLALLSVAPVDLAGATLSLGGLIGRADALPLHARVPSQFQPGVDRGEPAATLAADAGWVARVWSGVRGALTTVFRVHREQRPVDRLLPPEQEAMVRQLLLLKLEGARLALLRQEPAAYRELVDSARRWLSDYYQAQDPAVLAADSELERLRLVDLAPVLPEPSRSLERLRAVLRVAP